MIYKNGVVVEGYVWYEGEMRKSTFSDEIDQAIVILEKVSRTVFNIEPVMTCGIEGSHTKDSYHPDGDAIDLRSWIYKDEDIPALLDLWRKALPKPKYDVIYHYPGNPQKIPAHFHIEYNRRQIKKI